MNYQFYKYKNVHLYWEIWQCLLVTILSILALDRQIVICSEFSKWVLIILVFVLDLTFVILEKFSHMYVIPKRETIFMACEWVAGKVLLSVYLGYKSKSSTLLYFSFLAKVALPISYFHLRNPMHIVVRYNERSRKQTHWFEICEPLTDFSPYTSNFWSLFHTVRGHAFWQV